MAHKTRADRTLPSGLENNLDIGANLGFVGAAILAVLWFLLLPSLGILLVVVLEALTIVLAIQAWLLFRFAAETTRLMKLRNGLPYSGKVTSPRIIPVSKCSECQAIVYAEQACDSCGATFEDDN